MIWYSVILASLIHRSVSVIYHLNETEYERMPPLFSLDEYEMCLSRERSAYCLVKLDLVWEPNNQLMKLIHEYSEVTTKHYNHTYIERGVCVRRTCQHYTNNSDLYRKEDLESILGGCLNESVFRDYGLQAKLSKVYYCDEYNENMDIQAVDWAVAGVFGMIVLVNIIGTTFDVLYKVHEPEEVKGNRVLLILLSFSIIRNCRWLVFSKPEDSRLESFQGLHGIRFCINTLMILAHVTWIFGTGFIENSHFYEKAHDLFHYKVMYGGLVIVQTFLLLSGFLLVYNCKIHAEKSPINWKMIPKAMLLRYWRLTPALAAVIAFTSTWLRHLSSGPLWKLYVTNSVVADCRQYWWYHLLYINNYKPADKYCAGHTWYIAVDTQVFFMGLVVYLATRSTFRKLLLTVLLLLGIVMPAVHVWMWDLDGTVIMSPEMYRTMDGDTFRYSHVFAYNNLVCFVFGMLLGELVYKMQKNKVDISKNKVINFIVLLVVPASVLLFYSASIFSLDGDRASMGWRMTYAALQRLVMGVIIGFALFAIVMGCENAICKVSQWRGWTVPSRLSYSVYLLHFNIIYIFFGSRTQLEQASLFYMIIYNFGILALSYVLAVPFYIMVEAPFNRLMKTLMMTEKRDKLDDDTDRVVYKL